MSLKDNHYNTNRILKEDCKQFTGKRGGWVLNRTYLIMDQELTTLFHNQDIERNLTTETQVFTKESSENLTDDDPTKLTIIFFDQFFE